MGNRTQEFASRPHPHAGNCGRAQSQRAVIRSRGRPRREDEITVGDIRSHGQPGEKMIAPRPRSTRRRLRAEETLPVGNYAEWVPPKHGQPCSDGGVSIRETG
jgi:hypothetical protein